MEGKPFQEASGVARTFEQANQAENPTEQIIQAYTTLSPVAKVLSDQTLGKVGVRRVIRENAIEAGVPREKINDLLKEIFAVRNQVVHTGKIPTKQTASKFLKLVGQVLQMLHCI